MWFNEIGRFKLCETGINGLVEPIETCVSTCSGYTMKKK